MSELQWERPSKGFARSLCGNYQMSIATVRRRPHFLIVHVTGDSMNPYNPIGSASNAVAARRICQRHSDQLNG
jgi:hypothetical protein